MTIGITTVIMAPSAHHVHKWPLSQALSMLSCPLRRDLHKSHKHGKLRLAPALVLLTF